MNNESAAVEAVAWLVTNGGETCEPWLVYERNEVEALPASCIADPLYPQSALDALRGEVAAERERADKFMWQVRDTCARAEKAERRVAELLDLIATYKNAHDAVQNNPAMLLSDPSAGLKCAESMQSLEFARMSLFSPLTKESP